MRNKKIKSVITVSDNIDVIQIEIITRRKLEPIFFDSKANQHIPAKKISRCTSDIKEIILARIKSGFYDNESIKGEVSKKLLEILFKTSNS